MEHDEKGFDWKAAYGRLRGQHQRAVLELHRLRAVNAGLIATLDELNSSVIEVTEEQTIQRPRLTTFPPR